MNKLLQILFFFSFLLGVSTLTNAADIGLYLSKSGTNFNGQTIKISAIVKNYTTSGLPATGVEATLTIPSSSVLTSYIPSQGTFNSATGVWSIGSVPPNGTCTLYVYVKNNVSGDLPFKLEKTAQSDVDPVSNNNIWNYTFKIFPTVDVDVKQVVQQPPYTTGQPISFTLRATNNGPDSATNVIVYDKLPNGFTYVSSTASRGVYNSSTGKWMIGTLIKNRKDSLIIKAIVNPYDPNAKELNQITYSVTSPFTSFNFNTYHYVPQFLSSIGTLNYMTASQDIKVTTRLKYENTSTNSGSSVVNKATIYGTLDFPNVFREKTDANTIYDSAVVAKYDGIVDFAGSSGYDNGGKSIDDTGSIKKSTGLTPFIGTGSYKIFDSAFASTCTRSGGNSVFSISTSGLDKIEINYFYKFLDPLNFFANIATIASDQWDSVVDANNTSIGIIKKPSTLPVELLVFNAVKKVSYIELNWETASEINNSHFEIERSINGNDFRKIGTIQGNGNSQNIISYEFIDNDLEAITSQLVYYRLKQVDFNGRFEYFNIIKINNTASNYSHKDLWMDGSSKTLKIAGEYMNEFSKVEVYDFNGKLIDSKMLNLNQSSIEFPYLNLGNYLFSFTGMGRTQLLKVVLR